MEIGAKWTPPILKLRLRPRPSVFLATVRHRFTVQISVRHARLHGKMRTSSGPVSWRMHA